MNKKFPSAYVRTVKGSFGIGVVMRERIQKLTGLVAICWVVRPYGARYPVELIPERELMGLTAEEAQTVVDLFSAAAAVIGEKSRAKLAIDTAAELWIDLRSVGDDLDRFDLLTMAHDSLTMPHSFFH